MSFRTLTATLCSFAFLLALIGCGGGSLMPPTNHVTAPAIMAQPASLTVNAGQTATFTVTASGTQPLSYQWQKGSTNIAGATSSSYTTPATVAGDDGAQFRVVVSNSAGSMTSDPATLTVHIAPAITQPPASTAVTAGQTATFSVTATGSAPLSYQWQKGGVNIAGATSTSYTTPATAVGDSGSQFRVVVSNMVSSVTSSPATLTVNPAPVAPSITQQPAGKTVTAGQTATFSVTATGTAPLTYQWQKGGVNIAGATASSYTTPATVVGDSGSQFQVVVSNSVGSVTSNPATLTVNPAPVAPSITQQPADATVTAGQTASFSVMATGTAPLSFQWQKGGVNIAGATASSYTTSATVVGDSGSQFRVVVSNSAGSITSNPATLTVNPPPVAPSITQQPADATVTAGQTATFSVTASGTAPLSYQWQEGGVNIAGATASSYTTPATVVGDSGSQFRVVVTNSVGNASSNPATLTVNPPPVAPSITQQPTDATVTVGQTATFSVIASGTAPLSYQWQKGGVNISGATSASYTTPPTVLADGGSKFRVVVSNSAGNVTSDAATLNVNAVAPSITQQPSDQTVTAGQTATFSVVANGTAPLNYQWEKNGANITGATSASYTTPATTLGDDGAQFVVVVSNSAGTTTSSIAKLTVNAPVAPSITQQPADIAVNVGQTATFTVVAGGTAPLTYQWQKGGSDISGATSSSYTTPPTTLADDTSQFTVVVSNAGGSITSNPATLTVNPVSSVDVLTYHNDIARTGQNLNETVLTPATVNFAQFGKIGNYPVDGRVDAQPLYAANVAVPSNGTHNLLIVVTEHDSVYAFDADSGAILWQTTMLASGESPSDDRGCSQVTPEIGVTATPVIDRTRGPNGVIYLVAMSKNGSTYHQRLHALDLVTGAELFSGPEDITASYPGTGDGNNGSGMVIFDPKQYKERVGLLLMNGVLHTAWASHCDDRPYTGWLMSYNADTLAQTSVLNVTPNGDSGAIWMAGAGLAADNFGNYYFLDGNGAFGTSLNSSGFPTNGDYGNAFLKISTTGGTLAVADYFEMLNGVSESSNDQDLGSGGAMVLPDLTDGSGNVHHLAVGVGKDAHLYVVDRDNMGKFNSSSNNIYQDITGVLAGGVFAMPAYFNGRIYYGAVNDSVKAFTATNARFATSVSFQTPNSFGFPGATPSVSANGTSNGIVWAVQNGSTAVLHAYDATNLNEIYNSNQASASRDHFGGGNKFITPTIVNGKVFVGTTNSVAVFGLLP